MVRCPLGESLDHRPVSAVPRPASTICLVRDTPSGVDVLLAQRTPEARFLGGAWVFPGGSIDDDDGSDAARSAVASSDPDLASWRAAAVRELIEETGIWLLTSGALVTTQRPEGLAVFTSVLDNDDELAGDSLHYFANWITPAPRPVRFDTRFFAAAVPIGIEPIVDNIELVDGAWIRPADALARAASGRWDIAFPTRRVLDFLGVFESTALLVASIASQGMVEAIQPRLSIVNGRVEVVMPGDPGFEAVAEGEPDRALLEAVREIARSDTGTVTELGSP